jgi:uncharacterized protein
MREKPRWFRVARFASANLGLRRGARYRRNEGAHTFRAPMSPRRYTVDPSKGVLHVDWPLFGELSRALALKVARAYQPEVVIGIATAGVVPGAAVAAILGLEFHSIAMTGRAAEQGEAAVRGGLAAAVRGRHVLIVDETCDTGETLDRAIETVESAGAAAVRTAVSFRTGAYEPDFHALATESTIVLPWDREVLVRGELVPNPLYAGVLAPES